MDKIKRPPSIKIASADIRFKTVTVDDLKSAKLDSDDLGAYWSFEETIDLIDSFNSPAQEANTVLHETLHGVWDMYGLQEGDGEERIVETVATALIQIFRDNPDLLLYIQTLLFDRVDGPSGGPTSGLKTS